MNRRQFLQTSAAVGVGLSLPANRFANATPTSTNRVLILIELKGGNDGLNTVIPLDAPAYHALRPNIGIANTKAQTITKTTGLHPSLKSLSRIYESGELSIVEGVGYPKPNRSHFRSIEIWDGATDADDYASVGWLKDSVDDSHPLATVTIGGNDEGPLLGLSPLDITNPNRLFRQTEALSHIGTPTRNAALSHIIDTQNSARSAVNDLKTRIGQSKRTFEFGGGPLARQLEMAARLLDVGAPVRVIKVSLGGFDTHANQLKSHARILGQLDAAMGKFKSALEKMGRWDTTTIMTYSEFGRRAKENGSGGTDHGTAAPMLIMGGAIKGGLYGKRPSLTDLGKNGDLKFTTDFRAVLNTVSKHVFAKSSSNLERFSVLPFV